jgi:predicted TIM-barrel fold metal-dependent hydrolase
MEQAGALGIPVCVVGAQNYLPGLGALATQFPGVPLVLEHLGVAVPVEDAMGLPLSRLDTLLGMAELPNVYLKVSTLNLGDARHMVSGATRGAAESMREDVLRRIVERFGVRRVMWGTNHPVSRAGSYADMARLGRTALPWLSDDERSWLLGETAATIWPRLRRGV